MPLLLNLLKRTGGEARSIIFVNTKAAAEKITERVGRYGHRVGALSGDVPQLKRQKLLQRFQDGQLDILVCTDVAARGLHIPAVSHVFNYDLPHDAEDYVHRIGRTGRLGAEGDAISFACDLYAMSLPDIETYIGQRIPVGQIEPEWLVMPKAPPQQVQSTGDEAPAAEAGAESAPRRRRRSRTGADRERTGPKAVAAVAAVASVAESPREAAADVDAGRVSEGGPRKRRRRRRSGGGAGSGEIHTAHAGLEPTVAGVESGAAVAPAEPVRAAAPRPVEITPVAMDTPRPAGLLKRLGRMLFGR